MVYLRENKGHGVAREVSLGRCRNELIAIMDSDDICVENRFEKQLRCFMTSNVDIVGGDIAEFIRKIDHVVGFRNVPEKDNEIKEYARKRCPFNQMTVMMKKTAYKDAGGYKDWYCDEDYYLWLRMIQKHAVMANTGEVLVYVRVGNDMYRRRGGWKYFVSEAKLQKYMLDRKLIGLGIFILNIAKRFIIQVLLPVKLRGLVFQKFARKALK